MDFFGGHQSTLDFQAKSLDIFGRPYVVSESIDITALVEQFKKIGVAWEPNYLVEIKRVLENIEKEVRNLRTH